MNSAFLKAAASYYGINPDQLRTSDWRNDGGSLVVSFEMTVSEADLEPIMARMKEMRQQPVSDATKRVADSLSRLSKQMEDELSTKSFSGWSREIKHIEVPEVEDTSKPEAVWVLCSHMDVQQDVMMASDSRWNQVAGQVEYLIQTIMLTPEQRARYVQPTSNADDFGGLPG